MPVMHKKQFLHYRFLDAKGNILPHGGVTVSYIPLEDGTVDVGFAYCSPEPLPENMYAKISGRGKAVAMTSIPVKKSLIHVSRKDKHKTYARKMTYQQLIDRVSPMIAKKLKTLQNRHAHWNFNDGSFLALMTGNEIPIHPNK